MDGKNTSHSLFFSPTLSLYASVYRWKLNDSFIQPRPGSRFSLMGGNLHISRLNKDEDVGIYQCLASNSFGTIVSREASLHIACKSYLATGFCFFFLTDSLYPLTCKSRTTSGVMTSGVKSDITRPSCLLFSSCLLARAGCTFMFVYVNRLLFPLFGTVGPLPGVSHTFI